MTTQLAADHLAAAPAPVRQLLTAHLMPVTLDLIRAGTLPVDQAVPLVATLDGPHPDPCPTCDTARGRS